MSQSSPFPTDESSGRDVAVADPDTRILCPFPADRQKTDTVKSDQGDRLKTSRCPLIPSIQDRLRFESLLTELSAKFVNVPANQVDSQIESGLRRIVELLGLDRSGLGEVSADGKQLVVTHSYQLPGIPPSAQIMLDARFPVYTRMIQQGLVVRLPDDLPPEATRERDYCLQIGLKSNLTIPLTVMGSVVGGIGFSSFRSHRILPDELIPRLRLVGDIFTNALARKRADESLIAKDHSLRSAQENLRQLAGRLIHSQEEERSRIAREMHDDWAQRLASLEIDTARLEAYLTRDDEASLILRTVREQVMNLAEDVHSLSRQLHPSILDDLGLVEALRSECASCSRREEMRVDYRPDSVPARLPREVALCVYRVAQEALRNAAKHAGIARVLVTLKGTEGALMLRVEDQGFGFDPESPRSHPGLGLASMAERVNLVRGTFSLTSAIGQGTTVEIRVPLDRIDT